LRRALQPVGATVSNDKLVLIVDDIQDYLDAIESLLPPDYRAVKVQDAAAARAVLADVTPAVAIIDIRLMENDPNNADGLELLRWARQHRPETPVIMMSAYQGFEYQAQSLSLGAHYFLKKPLRPDELTEVLDALLGRS